jgi:hypothetical protein
VSVKDLDAGAVAARARLGSAGVRIDRLEPIEPSMEDVFVALIEREEARAQ